MSDNATLVCMFALAVLLGCVVVLSKFNCV